MSKRFIPLRPRSWTLNAYLIGLLCLAALLSFSIVGATALVIRLPQIEGEARSQVLREAQSVALRQDLILHSIEDRLNVMAMALLDTPQKGADLLLDRAVSNGNTFVALYLLDKHDHIQAGGSRPELRMRERELLGVDASAVPLVALVRFRRQLLWTEKQKSLLTGETVLAVAIPLADGRSLMAEIAPASLLRSSLGLLDPTTDQGASTVDLFLVDAEGQTLVDTVHLQAGPDSTPLELPAHLIWSGIPVGQPLAQDLSFGSKSYHVALSRSQYVNWLVVVRTPQGLDNRRVQAWVWAVIGGFFGTLLVGLLLSPFWARGLKRSLQAIVDQAHDITLGRATPQWPTGPVREFNQLSIDLEVMANSLRERQQQFQAIFEVSPVPLAVYDAGGDRVIDLNLAACRQFGTERGAVIGNRGSLLPIWSDEAKRLCRDADLSQGQTVEMHLKRFDDGRQMHCLITVRNLERNEGGWQVWAIEDITETRRVEQALRSLNEELEQRVAQRTAALQQAHDEVSQAIDRLHETRDSLVRSEKMAALGGLVAGVAHELNTPLGNSLMAISTLSDETQRFKEDLKASLRKSTLEAWIKCVEQAAEISARNLTRASDLVVSFKQVAVDQSSAQRRHFLLDDLVHEILMTLKPSYARKPIQFIVEVEPKIKIDSYPGHLGQILTNLITNAIMHGFEDERDGIITVRGFALGADKIVLAVVDDGKGIAPDLIDRVFDPFVTTRMGRGGTGLGLNICYNAATHVLGGNITVQSTLGNGSCFTVCIPIRAPELAGVSQDDVQTWD